MKFRTRPRAGAAEHHGLAGTVRHDRRIHGLLRRLRPGDIAVVDYIDLDRGTAEALLAHQVVAVVNLAPFISGRYPNLGPEVLIDAGITLVEAVPGEVVGRIRDGAPGRIEDGVLYLGEVPVLAGRVLTAEEVRAAMDGARDGLALQLQSFTHNTTEFLRREQGLLLHGTGAPELRTRVRDRPIVVVVRDFDYHADLRRLRRFIREQRPVLVGVDDGADALLDAGHKPDVVLVGERGLGQSGGDSAVSDKAVQAARDVVVHADATGRAPGADRLDRLGAHPHEISAGAATPDVALLLADLWGAALIVTVGTHATLDEFLDRQRAGLASTFLTRLRVGPRLVDAKSLPHLYAGRVRLWHLWLVLLAGLLAVVAAIAATPVGAEWWDQLRAGLTDLSDATRGLLP